MKLHQMKGFKSLSRKFAPRYEENLFFRLVSFFRDIDLTLPLNCLKNGHDFVLTRDTRHQVWHFCFEGHQRILSDGLSTRV